jgi:hypothetical protein
MTIPEIVAQLRTELIECVNSDKAMSVEERSFFTTVQNALDEEIIAFWLSLYTLRVFSLPKPNRDQKSHSGDLDRSVGNNRVPWPNPAQSPRSSAAAKVSKTIGLLT